MSGVVWALVFIGFLAALIVADLAVGAYQWVRAWRRRRRLAGVLRRVSR